MTIFLHVDVRSKERQEQLVPAYFSKQLEKFDHKNV